MNLDRIIVVLKFPARASCHERFELSAAASHVMLPLFRHFAMGID